MSPAITTPYILALIIATILTLLSLILLTLQQRRLSHAHSILTLQTQQRRYRHLDSQTRLVTATFKDTLHHQRPPAELALLATARRRDTDVWAVLGPCLERQSAGGRRVRAEVERVLVAREELSRRLEELHREVLGRIFNVQYSHNINLNITTDSDSDLRSHSSAHSHTLSLASQTSTSTACTSVATSVTQHANQQVAAIEEAAAAATQTEFYRRTRFDFEDRKQRTPDVERGPSSTLGGFNFGFGGEAESKGLRERASVLLKTGEEEERKKGWFEWVSMHLI